MILFDLNPTRLQQLAALWGTLLDRWRGPVPRSLGLAHMTAETYGNPSPSSRDLTQRTVGLMRLRVADVQRLGQTEESATDPTLNLYLWCRLANEYGQWLHANFSAWWTAANLDFWLAIRIVFMLGQPSTGNLFTTVAAAGTAYRSTAGVQQWIRTQTQGKRFGRFGPFELRQLANHLDEVLRVMTAFDGAHYVAPHFFASVPAFQARPGENSRLAQSIDNLAVGTRLANFTP
jgi:hypothetical protein